MVEAQWKSYVVKLRESGTLSSCLAVADVSGSMSFDGGQPLEVSRALQDLHGASGLKASSRAHFADTLHVKATAYPMYYPGIRAACRHRAQY